MKKSIVIFLIGIFLFNSIAYALPFDEERLLKLDPLLSERIKKKAEETNKNKIWVSLGIGAIGAGLIAANLEERTSSSDENARLSNLAAGVMLLAMGMSANSFKNPVEVDLDLLNSLSKPGIDRERLAYSLYQKTAKTAKTSREWNSLWFTFGGLGFALTPILTPNASNDQKTYTYILGLLFCGFGLFQYNFPWPIEREMEEIDSELNQSNL